MEDKITYNNWDIDYQTLLQVDSKIEVKIHLTYPDFKEFIHLSIEDRIPSMRKLQRDNFQTVKKALKGYKLKKTPSNYDTRSIQCELETNKIIELIKLKEVAKVSVLNIPNHEKKTESNKKLDYYFGVKCRFAIEIEGRKQGFMDFDENIILIKAENHDDAKSKILKCYDKKVEAYMNSNGQLVRWRFDGILDIYESNLHEKSQLDDREGVEVYSRLVTKKIRPEYVWNGKQQY